MIIHTIKKTQALLMHIVRFILGEEALIEGQSKTKHSDIPVRSWIDICTNTYCTSLLVRQKWSSSICRSWKFNANTWQKQIQTLMLVFTDWTFTNCKRKFLDLLLKVLTTWRKKIPLLKWLLLCSPKPWYLDHFQCIPHELKADTS